MKILIVDDYPAILAMLENLLVSRGHTVITANNGDAAVDAYRSNPDIGITITDKDMPNKNGLELIRDIRVMNDSARIWLITADAVNLEEIEKEAKLLGAEEVISKFDGTKLFSKLKGLT